jgi:hypothetical protein
LFSEIFWGVVLAKKAIIIVGLVEESEEKRNVELEREILEELSKAPHVIP